MDTAGRGSFGVSDLVAAAAGGVTAVVNVNAVTFPVVGPFVFPDFSN